MSVEKPSLRILFLNQVAGPLFRELAEDLAKATGNCALLSGHLDHLARPLDPALKLIPGPDYDRRSPWHRAVSWLAYFGSALRQALQSPQETLLFVVSNPPFLALVGLFLRVVRGQRYVILVYDVYPNLLVNLGRLRPHGFAARLWRWFNRLTWKRAETVFTIGDYMAANVRAMLPAIGSPPVVVIPNWADGEFVRPLPKEKNAFAQAQQQVGKFTVLYAGNLGSTHDIESILAAARRLREHPSISFLIIGAGAKWSIVERAIQVGNLSNVLLLPFQPEKDLPQTLTTADVAIVTLENGIEGCSVPSKTAYAMASGAALIGLARRPNELTDIIDKFQCGLVVEPGDVEGLLKVLHTFHNDPAFLAACRQRARRAMEIYFSRNNTGAYLHSLKPLLAPRPPVADVTGVIRPELAPMKSE